MRIIAGTCRGRRLQAPPGLGTRPMLDRVREAIFSSLGERIDDARVLDLFAGTGSLGLEAASRGAGHVRFVERDRRVAKLIERNAETLGLEDACEVVTGDALSPAGWGGEPWDVVFLDPPYPMVRSLDERRIVLDGLEALRAAHLAPGGVVVLHTPRNTLRASDLTRGGVEPRLREYGTNAIWYLAAGGGE